MSGDRLREAREVIQEYERSRPAVVELAELASLAVRIEPELLRALRRKLAPHLDVGVEGDLWFSRLVQARGADGITFSAEIAEILQSRLQRERQRLERAWKVTATYHRSISPALQLEEEVTYHAVSGADQEVIEKALAPALVALTREGRTGLAPWAARALPRLPEKARSTRVAWALSLTASRQLSGRLILEEGAPPGLMDEDLLRLLSEVREVDLGIRRQEGILEVGDLRGPGISMIRVGETAPRLVEARWEDDKGEHRKILSIRPGSFIEEEVGWGAVRLRTLTGAVYELPALERSEAQSPGVASIQEYYDFAIRFQPSTDEEYFVLVESSPVGEARGTFRLSDEIQRILEGWSRYRGVGEDVVKDLGARLWRALFAGPVGQCFERSLAFAERSERGLRIRFRLAVDLPSAIVSLPWELLYSEERQQFLCLDWLTSVVRSLDRPFAGRRLPSIPSSEPLRILLVTASPAGGPPLDLKQDLRRIRAGVGHGPGVEIVHVPNATLASLATWLFQRPVHILHFTGHGSTGGLIFEDTEGRQDLVPGKVLADLLSQTKYPPLVVLNAAWSVGPPAEVAESLLAVGVPAVVGTQMHLSDRAARIFFEWFYREVAAGRPLDVAMAVARHALYIDSSQDVSWAVPVLLMNEIEGTLFERAAEMAQDSRALFNPLQLSTAGWGIIFAPDIGEDVREALRPLMEWRRRQAGELFKTFEFQPGQTAADFLRSRRSRGVEPGAIDPKSVPYYLLLVGDPRAVPFDFQAELDVEHAVGRLWFERIEEYSRYAQSVLRTEHGLTRQDRQITFFGVENQDDPATQQLCQGLVLPLAQEIEQHRRDWQVRLVHGEQATKEKLRWLLSKSEMPALLFTASHGASFPPDDPRQFSDQGALICQNWPGPKQGRGELPRDHYFSAEDLAEDVNLSGMIAFLFLCFGAGTPEYDSFMFHSAPGERPRRIAPHPFIARLPQKLLDRGVLAVLSHGDRAWTMSFRWEEKTEISLFKDMLERLLDGVPVGHAMEPFGHRSAELATQLARLLEEQALGSEVDAELIARLRVAVTDARSFSVFGDPAVRLKVEER